MKLPGALPPKVNVGGNLCFAHMAHTKGAIHACQQHIKLKNNLIEHVWDRFQNRHLN
jgi:hypothetical protein